MFSSNSIQHLSYLLIFFSLPYLKGLPSCSAVKETTCHCRWLKRLRFDPWAERIPWRRKWQPTPVFLPGKSDGQRCLAGYTPGPQSVEYNWACICTMYEGIAILLKQQREATWQLKSACTGWFGFIHFPERIEAEGKKGICLKCYGL